MGRYAEQTAVSAEKSRAEIEQTLARYGADQFVYGWEGNQAMIAFRMSERRVRFLLPLPDKDAPEFWRTPSGRRTRSAEGALVEWEKATRQRWRALSLVVKAKLEAVAAGIAEFEDEFLAYIMLPGEDFGGLTVGQAIRPDLARRYELGHSRGLLQLPAPAEDIEDAEVEE